MAEDSRFWDGTTGGDATSAPYDAATEFAQVISAASGSDALTGRGAVVDGALNELAVSGSSSPVSVATGRAFVYGTWYENDAIDTVAIPTPAASTRIDRIVLRKSWADKTVRIERVAGVEGGSAPALTQVASTTWEISLATVSITTGGVITVTDTREFIGTQQSTPALTVVAITFADTPYSVPGWNYYVQVDATGGAVEVRLPTAVGNGGKIVDVVKTDASVNAVTVEGNAAETINDAANKAISTRYVSYTFISNGADVRIK